MPGNREKFLSKCPGMSLGDGQCRNRPFSYSEKEPQSNDLCLHFEEFSNVHNSDRSPNATRSNFAHENV